VRSAAEPIDDSPTGKLMEAVLAGIAQFDNDVKGARAPGLAAALGVFQTGRASPTAGLSASAPGWRPLLIARAIVE
jgi:hypothetical protein